MADGDELELLDRLVGWDAQAVRLTLEMRIRLWSQGKMLREETRKLTENDYAAQQLADMLRDAGFLDVQIAANYTDRPYAAGDKMVSVIARKQP
jgi:hypothetical protein